MFNLLNKSDSQPTPIITHTGELTQPIRLHYKILNSKRVLAKLQDLKCIGTNIIGKRFQWHLSYEAKKEGIIQLTPNYSHMAQPVLGFIFISADKKSLIVRVLSTQRAIFALQFFDKHIPSKYLKVENLDAYNRVLTATSEDLEMVKNSDLLFPPERITIAKVGESLDLLDQWKAEGKSQAEMQQLFAVYMEAEYRRDVPEIEHFPIHFYEDGIKSVEMSLGLRQMVAIEHLKGNTNFRIKDAIDRLVGR
jgi:hypothetical protein